MISKLSLLDAQNQPGTTYDLDALSERLTSQPKIVTIGGPTAMIKVDSPALAQSPLQLSWVQRASAWTLSSTAKDVAVNSVELRSGEARTLAVSSCIITCGSELAMILRRSPAQPLYRGEPFTKVFIPPEGLTVGRGTVNRQEKAKAQLTLDPEIYTISSLQAELKRGGDGVYLINHHDHPKYRTKLNADQGFSKQRLVFGDCIQIADYDYYTFQFDGSSLVHIGEGGAIQARGLTRTTDDGFIILADVDFDLQCGEFVGVLGGSGQGKSTLMKAVCGLAPLQEGKVRVEGRLITGPGDMAKTGIGYVPQEDIVHRELTVRQALVYGSMLRISLPRHQLEEVVDTVLRTLPLIEHQHKPVRVLSGGQCKRVSIASELIMSPRFLFLDEPTSGLDPQTESELMTELSVLARNKRMGILCTTHVLQNSHLFKAIVWVHGGRIIFQGRSADAVRYFLMADHRAGSQTAGRKPGIPSSGTTAAHSSAIASTDLPKDDELLSNLPKVYGELARRVNREAENMSRSRPENSWSDKREINAGVAAQLAAAFNQWDRRPHLLPVNKNEPPEPAGVDGSGIGGKIRSFTRVFHRQWKILSVLFARQWKILISDPRNYLFLLMQAVAIGSLVGWVSENLVFQMFITVIATLWFGCSNGAQQIVSELPIFRRERLAGVGLNVYIISKLAFQTAITSVQAMLLFLSVLCTHHIVHPEILPTADGHDKAAEDRVFAQLFFANRPEYMNPRAAPPSANEPTPAVSSAATDDFAIVDADNYVAPTTEHSTRYRNPTGLIATDRQFQVLAELAWFFRIKENVLDELGVREDTSNSFAEMQARYNSWERFFATLLALRFSALLAAAFTGVALGLLVSASVSTVTQAVMWVPLILIPQILFGGFVVTAPEMASPVLWFSRLLPSFNLQRLMDTANLHGRTTPQMSNKTKIPAFLASPPYEEETVRYVDSRGVNQAEKYDKMSEVSKSWQNLVVIRDAVGKRLKEPDRDTVDSRRDVIPYQGDRYRAFSPAYASWRVLALWLAGCYGLIVLNLSRKQAGQ